MKKTKVLFVCLGNICRSPAAEGAFKYLIQKEGLENKFYIDSCGTGDYHIGESSHPTTIKIAKQDGIQLTHKARQLKQADFDEFDYILAMDDSNLSNILKLATTEEHKKKIYKFRKFDPDADGEPDVPDPYFGGEDGFKNVQKIVLRTAGGLLTWMMKKLD